MKIVISETQRNNLIEGIFLSDEEKKQRLEKSIKLSKDYSRPRQFALEHPKLWAWLRAQNLVDVVFPNRQKYRSDGYWTIDTIGQESTKYNSRSEFERGNQWAYEKARKLGILDALFPTRKTTYDKKM